MTSLSPTKSISSVSATHSPIFDQPTYVSAVTPRPIENANKFPVHNSANLAMSWPVYNNPSQIIPCGPYASAPPAVHFSSGPNQATTPMDVEATPFHNTSINNTGNMLLENSRVHISAAPMLEAKIISAAPVLPTPLPGITSKPTKPSPLLPPFEASYYNEHITGPESAPREQSDDLETGEGLEHAIPPAAFFVSRSLQKTEVPALQSADNGHRPQYSNRNTENNRRVPKKNESFYQNREIQPPRKILKVHNNREQGVCMLPHVASGNGASVPMERPCYDPPPLDTAIPVPVPVPSLQYQQRASNKMNQPSRENPSKKRNITPFNKPRFGHMQLPSALLLEACGELARRATSPLLRAAAAAQFVSLCLQATPGSAASWADLCSWAFVYGFNEDDVRAGVAWVGTEGVMLQEK